MGLRGDGTSKLYASAGRFYYALPTDLNVRVFTANSAVTTLQLRPRRHRSGATTRPATHQFFQGGSASGEPVDGWTDGQSRRRPTRTSCTLGVEKALDPTLSVGVKGTYRTLGRTVEDRCDLDAHRGAFVLRSLQPGWRRPGGVGRVPDLQRLGQPDRPDGRQLHGDRRRRSATPSASSAASSSSARKQFTNQLWAQVSFLLLLAEGQLLRRHPRGLGPDGPRHQRRLRLLPVPVQRLRQPRARPAGPGPHRRGLQRAVRSLGRASSFYVRCGSPDLAVRLLQLRSTRTCCTSTGAGSNGRTPTRLRPEPVARVQLNVGPVTITPQALPLQRDQPADGHQRTTRPSTRTAASSPTRPAPSTDRPACEPGTARNLPGVGRGALHGQPGLPQGQRTQQPATPPRGAQGHLLGIFVSECFSGAASAAPFFWRSSDRPPSAARREVITRDSASRI